MQLSIVIGNTQSPTHITIDEAVRFSGYSDQYIRRLARDGRITGLKIAHIWMIELASLTAYQAEVQETQIDDARYGPRRSPQEALDESGGNGGLNASD